MIIILLVSFWVVYFLMWQSTGFNADYLWKMPINTLVSWGGVAQDLVFQHNQFYRLVTAGWLHGGIAHILMNSFSLCLAGLVLQRFLGSIWVFSTFALGVVGGTLLSAIWNSPQVLSVGASGGIMSLFGLLMVVGLTFPKRSRERHDIHIFAGQALVPALVPVFTSHIDYAGHFGGTLCGIILGGIAYFFRPHPVIILGLTVGILGCLLFLS